MADVATLGIQITSNAQQASRDLDSLSSSASRAEKATEGLGAKARTTATAKRDLANAAREATTGTQSLERAMLQAERAAQNLGGNIGMIAGISRAAAGAVGMVFAAVAAASGYAFVQAQQELMAIDRIARMTGQSLRDVQNFRNAGSLQGINTDQIDKGLRGVAERLNEARREENELTKLLDANNVRYKDRQGQIIGVNDALGIASRLIQNAASELDKVDIAKKLGLSEEWIRILERGPAALQEMLNEANRLGYAIDEQMVGRARQFDREWNAAIGALGIYAKNVFLDIFKWVSDLIGKARELLSFGGGAPSGALRDSDRRPGEGPILRGSGQTADAQALVDRLTREAAVGSGVPLTGGMTVVPRSGAGGGGGSDEAASNVEKLTQRLDEQTRVLREQIATMGLSTWRWSAIGLSSSCSTPTCATAGNCPSASPTRSP